MFLLPLLHGNVTVQACIPAQTLDFVNYSLLSEAQTSGVEEHGWECYGRNSCGWALLIRVCVRHEPFLSLCLILSAFLQSYPGTEGQQSCQWVGVRERVRKTTTGSVSAWGLSTASASCICLTFPKQK